MDPSLANLVERHHIQTWAMMGRAAGGELIQTEDRLLARAALDHIPYNHVLRCSPNGDPDDLIDEILATMRGREAIWSVTPSSPADLAERLLARGCSMYVMVTGMARRLTTVDAPELPSGAKIEEVGPALLETWADLVLHQWHLSEADRSTLLAMHHEFGFDRVRRWLCFLDGKPVAKASIATHEPGVAGIYGVGTREEGRGRGIATAMMRTVLRALADSGIHTVVLQSTPMAVGIYGKLGFETHCEFPVLTLPDCDPGPGRISRV